MSSTFRYLELADTLERQVRNGSFASGEKLPSIRLLHRETGMSISTVYHAFVELEKRGVVEARQKSGYFVKPLLENILPAPQISTSSIGPAKVTISNLAFALCEAMGNPDILQLGGALIAPELLPGKALAKIVKSLPHQELRSDLASYKHYMGDYTLRRRIARRMATLIGPTEADELVITNGCMEAIAICLQAVARPGDTVAVESPTFPWFLQVIENFGMYALELPSTCKDGINLDQLAQAIKDHRIQACLFNPNFNNPLGFLMEDAKKAALVDLLTRADIPIIEDDIYGELYFSGHRPTPLKAFDKKGLILYCASFSKTLSPGLRVGWTFPGRFLEQVRHIKLNQTICGPGLPQRIVGSFLQSGSFERHMRRLRTCLQNQVSSTALAVARYFPYGTKISAPKGGLSLWVQLPSGIDSLELFRQALTAKIAVLPGIICASTAIYRNCIRLSCGMPWNARLDQGINKLAHLVKKQQKPPKKNKPVLKTSLSARSNKDEDQGYRRRIGSDQKSSKNRRPL